MRRRGGRRAFVAALLVASVALACLALASPAGATDRPTPDELVRRLQHAARRPGEVVHTTTTPVPTDAGFSQPTVETWTDLRHGRMRQQVAFPVPMGTLILGDRQFSVNTPDGKVAESSTGPCRVLGATATLMGLCDVVQPGFRVDAGSRVEAAEQDGSPAWTLTTPYELRDATDVQLRGTKRVWFDRSSALPTATEDASSFTRKHETNHQYAAARETSEFVPARSLPHDFFTAESFARWAKEVKKHPTHPSATLTPASTQLRSGVASDGTTWTLSETDQTPCFALELTEGTSTSRGEGVCTPAFGLDRRRLPFTRWSTRRGSTLVVVGAPAGTETVEVVARDAGGRPSSENRILNSDPIAGTNGGVAFVLELPDGLSQVRAASAVS